MLSYASVTTPYHLEKLEGEIQQLEDDIYEHEKQIVALRRSLVLKRAEHARKRNEAASVSSLPFEILSMVFLFCKNNSTLNDYCSVEMDVSHVCTYWRDVALATPFLWTHIYADRNSGLDRVAAYLKRSQLLPITIGAYISAMDTSRFCDLTIPHAKRWKTLILDIDLTHSSGERAFSCMIQRFRDLSVPQLQCLDISCDQEWNDDYNILDVDEPQIFLGGAPSLVDVSLDGEALYTCWPFYTALTTLRLLEVEPTTRMEYTRLCAMISSSPSLTCLVISQSLVDEDSEIFFPAQAPSLKSLCICGPKHAFGLYSRLLMAISAPELESLSFDSIHDVNLEDLMSHSVEPRFPKLHFLSLRSTRFSDAVFSLLILAFPTITRFALDSSPSHAILELLSNFDLGVCWPHLREVSLTGRSSLPNRDLLLQMVHGRIDMKVPLQALCLEPNFSGYTHPAVTHLRQHVQVKVPAEWLDEWEEISDRETNNPSFVYP